MAEIGGVCERTGKRILSYLEAERAAKRVRRRRHVPMQAFRCDACRGWHTGHRPV